MVSLSYYACLASSPGRVTGSGLGNTVCVVIGIVLQTISKFAYVSVKTILYKIQKHFQNVMLVGMASENSKNYTYKCVDRSRHNGIKGAKAKCAH